MSTSVLREADLRMVIETIRSSVIPDGISIASISSLYKMLMESDGTSTNERVDGIIKSKMDTTYSLHEMIKERGIRAMTYMLSSPINHQDVQRIGFIVGNTLCDVRKSTPAERTKHILRLAQYSYDPTDMSRTDVYEKLLENGWITVETCLGYIEEYPELHGVLERYLLGELEKREREMRGLLDKYFYGPNARFPAYKESRLRLVEDSTKKEPGFLVQKDGQYEMNATQKGLLAYFQSIGKKQPSSEVCNNSSPFSPIQGAFMQGTPGIGKTHMFMAYARHMMEQNYIGLITELRSGLSTSDGLRDAFRKLSDILLDPEDMFCILHKSDLHKALHGKSLDDIKTFFYKLAENKKFIFLDELTLDDNVAEAFGGFILHRYNHRGSVGGLFVTTNVSVPEFLRPLEKESDDTAYPHGQLHAQVESRLHDLCRGVGVDSYLKGGDYRRRNDGFSAAAAPDASEDEF